MILDRSRDRRRFPGTDQPRCSLSTPFGYSAHPQASPYRTIPEAARPRKSDPTTDWQKFGASRPDVFNLSHSPRRRQPRVHRDTVARYRPPCVRAIFPQYTAPWFNASPRETVGFGGIGFQKDPKADIWNFCFAALVSGEKTNFQFILRLLNTNVDGKQKIMYALTRIKGVGRRYANLVCKKADVDLTKRYVLSTAIQSHD